jgi:hypothetical protein
VESVQTNSLRGSWVESDRAKGQSSKQKVSGEKSHGRMFVFFVFVFLFFLQDDGFISAPNFSNDKSIVTESPQL